MNSNETSAAEDRAFIEALESTLPEALRSKPDEAAAKLEAAKLEAAKAAELEQTKRTIDLESFDPEALSKDPRLGPILQSWADKRAVPQISAALERERSRLKSEASSQAEAEVLADYFSSLNQEELAGVLASDPEMAAAYARYKAQQPDANIEAVTTTAKVYAFATEVAAVNRRLDESGLDEAVKASLDPYKFTHLGDAGIIEWAKAVDDAILNHRVAQQVQKELATKWEAYLEERKAELERLPGASTPGRRASPLPDLMETPSSVLLERAFRVTS